MTPTTDASEALGDERETAPCTKCTTEIPVEADRCPQCGHEPGPGILGGITMWVSGILGSVFMTIAVVSLVLIATGVPVINALIVFAFTGGIGAFFGAIVYAGYRSARRGPTEQMFGEPDEPSESDDPEQTPWERGEAIGERVNDLGPAITAALPQWTWTTGVLLGVVLHLSLWVATAQESELGMGVALLGGIIVSFVAVMADSKRLEWRGDGYSPRWWFWTVPATVPLFGWIFGLAWILRKRQKTGSVV